MAEVKDDLILGDAWRSEDGGRSWSRLPDPPCGNRAGLCAAQPSGGELVFIGGFSGLPCNPSFVDSFCRDAWRSEDGGRSWRPLPAPPSDGDAWRRAHACLRALPDGCLIVLGGAGGTHGCPLPKRDAWRSEDGGRSWSRLPDQPWEERDGAGLAALPDGALVLVGGWAGGHVRIGSVWAAHSDVWRSEDGGASWSRLPDMPWGPKEGRSGLSLTALPDGALVALAGYTQVHGVDVFHRDVWRSEDGGHNWSRLPEPPWPERESRGGFAALPDGSLILLGGKNSEGVLNDAWRSEDGGRSWSRLPDQPWNGRCGHALAVLPDGSLVLAGGRV